MRDLAELLAPPTDAVVERTLAAYAETLSLTYGSRLVGLFLFGSRARGDHRPDSDVDLAVVVTDVEGDALAEKMRLVDLGFDALTEHGVMIQPWPFTQSQWDGREAGGRFVDLLSAARRDAKPVFVRS